MAASLAVLFCSTLQPLAALQAPVNDSHPKIFIAPIPDALNTRTLYDYDIPRFFTQFGATPNGVWSNPIGDYITERDDMELRNTYMYGLDVLFHRQLLQSPLRVHSAEDADLIYIPAYVDLGCRLSQENEADAAAWKKATDLFWGTFEQKFPYARTKPHFIVSGRREAENMAYCGVSGTMYGKVEACNFLCHPYAERLLVLTVEVFTGSLEVMAPKPLRNGSITVPWPGHWHMHLGSKYFQTGFDASEHKARRYLAMESLKVRLPLRELLYKSCMERSDRCLHYEPRGKISQYNQSEIYSNVKSAWYCIQPPGDGPSRHATMDCLAADTMPVFFDKHLTAVMPFSDIIDYSEFTEYMDPDQLQQQGANAIDVLQASFGEEQALRKAARLHQVKHLFLYSMNPEHSLIRWDEAYSVHPLDDAFTASIKALLRRSCELNLLPSTGRCAAAEDSRRAARGTQHSAAAYSLLKPIGNGNALSTSQVTGSSDIRDDKPAGVGVVSQGLSNSQTSKAASQGGVEDAEAAKDAARPQERHWGNDELQLQDLDAAKPKLVHHSSAANENGDNVALVWPNSQ